MDGRMSSRTRKIAGVTAGFVAGVIVAASGAAVAGDRDKPDARCHTWRDGNTVQCNLYAPENAEHVRIVLYVGPDFDLGVDYRPGWVERSTRIEHAR